MGSHFLTEVTVMHKLKALTLCGLFIALLAIGARLSIPLFGVPITMQTPVVLLCGLLLGKKFAPLTVGCYLALGLLGLPVFNQGGGIGYLVQPTFGYLVGFLACSFILGWFGEKQRPALGVILGLFLIYLLGSLWYYIIATLYLSQTLSVSALMTGCVLTTLPLDCVMAILSLILYQRLKRHIH